MSIKMKKFSLLLVYKIAALFYKIHKFFWNMARKMDRADLSISDRNKEKWYADGAEKTLRYNYDLNAESVVVDVGGYEGDFAAELYARYKSKIYVFEPVSTYIKKLQERFRQNQDIRIISKGLGARNEAIDIYIMDEASSHTRKEYNNKGGTLEKAEIMDVVRFMEEHAFNQVDLIKINIEGAEYDLLDRIIEQGLLNRFKNLQIQFHDFYPDFQARYNKIRKELEKNHTITFEYPFVWENWRLK
jgi:FkbM family methyltransferase